MTWQLIHDSETRGEWTDEYIQKVANQVADDTLDLIYEFLPDPIAEKLTGNGDSGSNQS